MKLYPPHRESWRVLGVKKMAEKISGKTTIRC